MRVNSISSTYTQQQKKQSFQAMVNPTPGFNRWVKKIYKNDREGFDFYKSFFNYVKKEQANNKFCDMQLFIGTKPGTSKNYPAIKVMAKESGCTIVQYNLLNHDLSKLNLGDALTDTLNSANDFAKNDIEQYIEYLAENLPQEYTLSKRSFVFVTDYFNEEPIY